MKKFENINLIKDLVNNNKIKEAFKELKLAKIRRVYRVNIILDIIKELIETVDTVIEIDDDGDYYFHQKVLFFKLTVIAIMNHDNKPVSLMWIGNSTYRSGLDIVTEKQFNKILKYHIDYLSYD